MNGEKNNEGWRDKNLTKPAAPDSFTLQAEICNNSGNYDSIISKTERSFGLSDKKKCREDLHALIDGISDHDLKKVFDFIALEFFEKNLPASAPELYKLRADRKEAPDLFIRRVYKHWLGKGLLRPHIKDLDEPLYRALYKRGIPEDFSTLLPTAQGKGGGGKPLYSDSELGARTREKTRERARRLRASREVKM